MIYEVEIPDPPNCCKVYPECWHRVEFERRKDVERLNAEVKLLQAEVRYAREQTLIDVGTGGVFVHVILRLLLDHLKLTFKHGHYGLLPVEESQPESEKDEQAS